MVNGLKRLAIKTKLFADIYRQLIWAGYEQVLGKTLQFGRGRLLLVNASGIFCAPVLEECCQKFPAKEALDMEMLLQL